MAVKAKARVLKPKSKPRRKVAQKTVRAKAVVRRPRLKAKAETHHEMHMDELQDQLMREAKQAVHTPWIQWAVGVLFVGTLIPVIYNLIPTVPKHAPPFEDPAAHFAASELDRALAEVSAKTPAERVSYWALTLNPDWVGKLMVLPNRLEIQDVVPLVPLSFDCTTFVETVMALARSSSSGEFYRRLLDLRYHGQGSSFFDRNHFPEADWLPNNVGSGAVTDVTNAVAEQAGIKVKTETKRINRAGWFEAQMKKGAFPGLNATEPALAWQTPVSAEVSYLPVDQIDRFVDHLPAGAVVNIVRTNTPKQWVLISHQAVVVRMKGVTYLRHSTRDGLIHTTPLVSYLKSLQGQAWPIVGLNVVKIASAP
jgi:hypothetical protein